MMKKYIKSMMLIFLVFLTACHVESDEERVAKATTLEEIVEAVTRQKPESAYVIDSTRYMAIIFSKKQQSLYRYNAMLVKNLIPFLLQRYPNVDRFFFGFEQNGEQYMKIQIDRNRVKYIDFQRILVNQLEPLATIFWPAGSAD